MLCSVVAVVLVTLMMLVCCSVAHVVPIARASFVVHVPLIRMNYGGMVIDDDSSSYSQPPTRRRRRQRRRLIGDGGNASLLRVRKADVYVFEDDALPPLVAHVRVNDNILRVLVDTGSADMVVKLAKEENDDNNSNLVNATEAPPPQCLWARLALRGQVPCDSFRFAFGACTCTCAIGGECRVRGQYADGGSFDGKLMTANVSLPVDGEPAKAIVVGVVPSGPFDSSSFIAPGVDGILGLAPAGVSMNGHPNVLNQLELAGVLRPEKSDGSFSLCAPSPAGGVLAIGGRYPREGHHQWMYAAQSTADRYTVDIQSMLIESPNTTTAAAARVDYNFTMAAEAGLGNEDSLPILDSGTNWATFPTKLIKALEQPLVTAICAEKEKSRCIKSVGLLLNSTRVNVCGYFTNDEIERFPDMTLLLRGKQQNLLWLRAGSSATPEIPFKLHPFDWAMSPVSGCHNEKDKTYNTIPLQMAVLDGGETLGIDKVTLGAFALSPYAVHFDPSRRRIGFLPSRGASVAGACAPPEAEAGGTRHAAEALATARVGASALLRRE